MKKTDVLGYKNLLPVLKLMLVTAKLMLKDASVSTTVS